MKIAQVMVDIILLQTSRTCEYCTTISEVGWNRQCFTVVVYWKLRNRLLLIRNTFFIDGDRTQRKWFSASLRPTRWSPTIKTIQFPFFCDSIQREIIRQNELAAHNGRNLYKFRTCSNWETQSISNWFRTFSYRTCFRNELQGNFILIFKLMK